MKTYRQFLEASVEDPSWAYHKASQAGHRVPELEPAILQSMVFANLYCRNVIKGRWPEYEDLLLKNKSAEDLFYYARDVIHGRWPEAEPFIMEDPTWIPSYAQEVIHGRWPEAEDVLWESEGNWDNYVDFLKSEHAGEKWDWLHQGVTSGLIRLLNSLGMNKVMQEYIIKRRPDLIGEIEHLDPKLKDKYSHERNLGNVDL